MQRKIEPQYIARPTNDTAYPFDVYNLDTGFLAFTLHDGWADDHEAFELMRLETPDGRPRSINGNRYFRVIDEPGIHVLSGMNPNGAPRGKHMIKIKREA